MISVVIPVYNEAARIADTLTAIYGGTMVPHQVIVADGGSSDATREIVKTQFPQVTLVKNPQRTAGAGRNVGIACATGDIIAFTDGDCLVDSHWLEEIQTAFDTHDIDGLGGRVDVAPPVNHYEAYWGNLAWKLIMSFGDTPYVVTDRRLNAAFVTANCAFRRTHLERLGGFSPWFGNHAEDVDLSWRALSAGAKLMYVPTVIISARNVTTLSGIAKKSFRNGFSSSKLQKKYGGAVNVDVMIYKMLGQNLVGILFRKKDAALNVVELSCHLAGKYYGSLRAGVINV